MESKPRHVQKQEAREIIARELCRMDGHDPEKAWHAWLANADQILFNLKKAGYEITERTA